MKSQGKYFSQQKNPKRTKDDAQPAKFKAKKASKKRRKGK